MKYIVVEVKTSVVVLLDQEGRFLKAANMNYDLGEVVRNPELMDRELMREMTETSNTETLPYIKEKDIQPVEVDKKLEEKYNDYKIIEVENTEVKKKRSRNRILSGLVAIAAVFALVFGITKLSNPPMDLAVYQSVILSINPDVNIDLNKDDQVVGLTGLNKDGRNLISDYEYENKDRNQVIIDLINKSSQEGFLNDGDEISFSLELAEGESFEDYGYKLRMDLLDEFGQDKYIFNIEENIKKDDDDDDDD